MPTVISEEKAARDAEVDQLRAISLSNILESRYGAVKDGPVTQSRIKSLGVSGPQQKFQLGKGHHINVIDDRFYFDLLGMKGGGGAIALVRHLEGCDTKTSIKFLKDWFPNYTQFTGKRSLTADQASETKKTAPPKVLPKFPFASFDKNINYTKRVEEYLLKVRGLPGDVVGMMIDNNLAYPVEKTMVYLVDCPGSRQLVDLLRAEADSKNYQCNAKLFDSDGQPYMVFKLGKKVPGVCVRMETRRSLLDLVYKKHEFKLPGSDDIFRPDIAKIDYQCELAFPILEFGSDKPIATSLRALAGSHKQVLGPKTKGAFVLGKLHKGTTKLILTESPIEAACYFALKRPGPEVVIYGLSGNGNIDELYPYLKENGVSIVNAFNNEAAGRKFAVKVHESAATVGIKVEDDVPPNGEASIECDDDAENQKYLERIRAAGRQHQLRFVEKTIPAEGGKKQRVRMRIESHAEIWNLLDIASPSARRKAMDDRAAGKEAEGIEHFRESVTVRPICKDWNDLLLGGKERLFTADYSRQFDRKHEYMRPPAPPPQPAVQKDTSTPPPEPPKAADGPDIGI
jgi:hypothetical protein